MKKSILAAAAIAIVGSAQASYQAPKHYDFVTGLARVPGNVTGYAGLKDRDDIIGASLVLPTIRSSELLQFQFETLLAPPEEVSVGPLTVKMPGNLHIPKQKERYGILPITIEKPSFGFYGPAGRDEELMALAFNAKLSDLIKLAQDKAPFSKMIPLVSMTQYTITPNRAWAGDRAITLGLNQSFRKQTGYRWTRNAAPANTADVALHFQQTPAKRWMLTDIVGTPAAQGQLATAPSLGGAPTRAYFARITNGEGQKIKSIEGHFVPSNGQAYAVQGVPEPIRNASVTGSTVRWTPIAGNGWMAVLRTGKDAKVLPQRVSPFLSAKVLRSLGGDERPGRVLQRTQKLEAWTSAATGRFDLSTALSADEDIVLLFVGTDRPVDAPSIEDEEPELFTFATEIRFVMLP